MTATVAGIHLGLDTHANRPAGNSAPDGSLYSCSTHNLVYKSNFAGNSWATWGTLSGGSGSVATDTIWDAAGDLVQGTGADAAAKLSAGLTGQALISAGAAAANAWKYPPGYEFDYVAVTSTVSPTATTEGTANTVVTGNAVTYDGSTAVVIEFFCPWAAASNTDGRDLRLWLYDNGSSIGFIGLIQHASSSTNSLFTVVRTARRITPTNAAHTYSIRASVSAGTGTLTAGAGGAGVAPPMFIRITKAA